MTQTIPITGVLIAGGQARRFGAAKAFALYNEKPFYKYSLEALASLSTDTLIISHPDLVDEFMKREAVPIYTDIEPYQGCGPLAGILTAINYTTTDWYLIAPCDTPLLTAELLQDIASAKTNQDDCVIPIVEGRKQPLIALYHRRTKTIIEELLKEGIYKVGALLERVEVNYLEASTKKKAFNNVNTKEDLLKIEKAEEQ
ncbi:molybdenum cofactor guanylyltransferase [Bacillus sp. FJAT-45350]|uniref:molybdenum cofactor guanylyltransferase n=1 Tax=Bacillus sp. FJAT-45350 TaxID=2011014 RepID=UPI000BB8AC47|nr:molybdenum cofactor guanylyltransferase [Bacillus sp. FJAT-45350]